MAVRLLNPCQHYSHQLTDVHPEFGSTLPPTQQRQSAAMPMVVVITLLSAAAYLLITIAIVMAVTPDDRETRLSVWDIQAREQRYKASEATIQLAAPVEMRHTSGEWLPQRPYNTRPYVKERRG
jgi:hypothetical protein